MCFVNSITNYLHFQCHIIYTLLFFAAYVSVSLHKKQDHLQISNSFIVKYLISGISCTTQKGRDSEHVLCVWGLVVLHHFAVQAD